MISYSNVERITGLVLKGVLTILHSLRITSSGLVCNWLYYKPYSVAYEFDHRSHDPCYCADAIHSSRNLVTDLLQRSDSMATKAWVHSSSTISSQITYAYSLLHFVSSRLARSRNNDAHFRGNRFALYGATIAFFLACSLAPLPTFAATTVPPVSDANTYSLWLMDGTVGSAAKIDNAESTAARDLVEAGAVTAGTGQTTPTANGSYNGFGANKNVSVANVNLATWPTGAQTYRMYLNPASCANAGSGLSFILSKQSATAGTYFGIDNNCKLIGRFSNGVTTKDWASPTAIATNAYTYVEIVFNPSTAVDVCINGVSDLHDTTGVPALAQSTTDAMYIGTQSNVVGDSTYSWTGQIDFMDIMTVARTTSDCLTYYNSAAAGKFIPWMFQPGF